MPKITQGTVCPKATLVADIKNAEKEALSDTKKVISRPIITAFTTTGEKSDSMGILNTVIFLNDRDKTAAIKVAAVPNIMSSGETVLNRLDTKHPKVNPTVDTGENMASTVSTSLILHCIVPNDIGKSKSVIAAYTAAITAAVTVFLKFIFTRP